jgi:hypothetical protein
MTQATQAPPIQQAMQMIAGGWVSQMLGAAAELGVADQLANGPKTAEDVAQAVGADAHHLARLLRALASMGVLAEQGGRYALTPVSELLRSDHPASVRHMAIMMSQPAHWNAWGKLTEGVRTGSSPFEAAFGVANVFDYYAKHPDEAAVFNAAMTNNSSGSIPAVVAAYDFAGIKKLMDVGGGHGALLTAIVAANPGMQGVLFDLPAVVAGAQAPGLEVVGGDFFGALPAGPDAIVMKHILHDWDDERCLKILTNCHQALPAGGKLLVVELVVPDQTRPGLATMMDINMLVMTPGGRERTLAEFRLLFERAGFKLLHAHPAAPTEYAVLEAVKA